MKTCGKGIAVALSVACLVVFCSAGQARAQRKGGGMGRGGSQAGSPVGPNEKIVPMEYDNGSFDITREELPRAYGGHNARVVFDALRASMAKAAREGAAGRQGPAGSGPGGSPGVAGTLKAGSAYAFQTRPADISYDKRGQVLRVYCQLWTVLAGGAAAGGKSGFRIDYIPQVDNRYTLSAPDGRKIDIEEVKFREYTVAFDNLGEFPVEKNSRPDIGQVKGRPPETPDDALRGETVVAGIPAAKAEADELERNVRLLVVCSITEPYATSEEVHLKGTADKPGEYLARHEYLHVRLLELWFYDSFTGRVLMKIRPDENKGPGSTGPGRPGRAF